MVFCNIKWSYYLLKKSWVTILILIDGFLQCNKKNRGDLLLKVTILILIDGFLQCVIMDKVEFLDKYVTILILIDGFLQCNITLKDIHCTLSHNPYFNRWFSAI